MTNQPGAQVITMWELYGCGMEQVAARVAEELGLPVHGQAFSSEQIEASKRQPLEDDFRRELSLQVFRFDPVGDDYYDLVVDATRFSEDEVVALIVAAAKSRAA